MVAQQWHTDDGRTSTDSGWNEGPVVSDWSETKASSIKRLTGKLAAIGGDDQKEWCICDHCGPTLKLLKCKDNRNRQWRQTIEHFSYGKRTRGQQECSSALITCDRFNGFNGRQWRCALVASDGKVALEFARLCSPQAVFGSFKPIEDTKDSGINAKWAHKEGIKS